ncbi:MAG: polyprenyl synthetase family protein [Nitrospiraceae bacterium]|nr:polyprenyl synthetase family protein [Nitrospiraceae bacterium]
MFNLDSFLKAKAGLVDSFLESYFSGARVFPARFKEAMAYSLNAGGKRIRPVLALAACEACGRDPATILPYACALELIHTYSLIHDDLPAMDDDDLRRGKPTNHKVYGEAMAILAGDGLLTEAFHILSLPAGGIDPILLLKVIGDVSERAGLRGMVAGQAQDILSESGADLPRADLPADMEETIGFIHMHKTAQLITASVRMGAILAGADEGRLAALTEYGQSVGMAFQVADDILDVKGETALMGKTAGSDQRKAKLTYPAVYGLEASERKARELVDSALLALKAFDEKAEPLRAIARFVIERKA